MTTESTSDSTTQETLTRWPADAEPDERGARITAILARFGYDRDGFQRTGAAPDENHRNRLIAAIAEALTIGDRKTDAWSAAWTALRELAALAGHPRTGPSAEGGALREIANSLVIAEGKLHAPCTVQERVDARNRVSSAVKQLRALAAPPAGRTEGEGVLRDLAALRNKLEDAAVQMEVAYTLGREEQKKAQQALDDARCALTAFVAALASARQAEPAPERAGCTCDANIAGVRAEQPLPDRAEWDCPRCGRIVGRLNSARGEMLFAKAVV